MKLGEREEKAQALAQLGIRTCACSARGWPTRGQRMAGGETDTRRAAMRAPASSTGQTGRSHQSDRCSKLGL